MHQMMPLEWTTLYALFLMTLTTFNVMNYFIKMPTKMMTKTSIPVKGANWKW
uniref:ATP synthase F0 subunit 8 n=1 Tax=Glossotermes oculatus TaxID=280691 RepID=A0A0A7E8Y2_9NEOP|nr:ATP synthase F0 subunit 8 [Glossotermes oculatus]URH16505.1 ATP synthase F0 subunit 8 [Glossotermes oculatus]